MMNNCYLGIFEETSQDRLEIIGSINIDFNFLGHIGSHILKSKGQPEN